MYKNLIRFIDVNSILNIFIRNNSNSRNFQQFFIFLFSPSRTTYFIMKNYVLYRVIAASLLCNVISLLLSRVYSSRPATCLRNLGFESRELRERKKKPPKTLLFTFIISLSFVNTAVVPRAVNACADWKRPIKPSDDKK